MKIVFAFDGRPDDYFHVSHGGYTNLLNSPAFSTTYASNRLRCFLPSGAVGTAFDTHVAAYPFLARNADFLREEDVLIAMKIGQGALGKNSGLSSIVNEVVSQTSRLIFDTCDPLHLSENQMVAEFQRSMMGRASLITAPTHALAQELASHAQVPVRVIEDAVEITPRKPAFNPRTDQLNLCWFGWMSSARLQQLINALVRTSRRLPNRKITCTIISRGLSPSQIEGLNDRFRRKGLKIHLTFQPFALSSAWDRVEGADLVLIPHEVDGIDRFKSHNRLLTAIQCGTLPIASAIPAYEEVASHAWLGADLSDGVQWALRHPDSVLEKLASGQNRIQAEFSPEAVGKKWVEIVSRLAYGDRLDKAQSIRHQGEEMEKVLRLNLGCGDKILEGYVNVDVAPSRAGKKPDVLCDLRKLEPFDDDSVDEVLSVHVVEHFHRWEILNVLKEWVRVLKPGGKMIIECPNLLSACQEIVNDAAGKTGPGKAAQRTMWVLYGDPNWEDPLMVHRWAYTPQSLADVMKESGLTRIRQEKAQYKLREPRDMRMVGEKLTVGPERKMNENDISQAPMSYLLWYYTRGGWKDMSWQGVRTLKLPSDMWNYQEIITEISAEWVVETGTRHGGSALFFADVLGTGREGKVISLDISHKDVAKKCFDDDRIVLIEGDSAGKESVERLRSLIEHRTGTLFMILDSDHSARHVLRELEALVPLLRKGDYLIVEDTIVNGHPVRPDHGPGPMEAIREYVSKQPGVLIRDKAREQKFGCTFAANGFYRKA